VGVLPDDDVVRVFGDPHPYVLEDGGISPDWETATLSSFPLPAPLPLIGSTRWVSRVRCHRLVVPFMAAAFATLFRADQWTLLHDFGGCYCWRTQRQAAKLSRHAWGIAVDLNVADNPFSVSARKAPPNMPPQVVRAFQQQGFAWGGDWLRRKDGMHFEFVDLGRLT
jgi:hypothetical protein